MCKHKQNLKKTFMKKIFNIALFIVMASIATAQDCKLLTIWEHEETGDTISYDTFVYEESGKLKSWLEESDFIDVLYKVYYDGDGRISRYTDEQAGGEAAVYTHFMNFENGKLVETVDLDDMMVKLSLTTYTYNEKGLLVSSSLFEVGYEEQTEMVKTLYSYDDKGNAVETVRDEMVQPPYISTIAYDDKLEPYYYIGRPETFNKHNILRVEVNQEGKLVDDYSYTCDIEYNEKQLPVRITTRTLDGYIISIKELVYSCK